MPWDTSGSPEPEGTHSVFAGYFTRIPNPLLEALYSSGFTSTEFRVILAIIRRTCGWGRLSGVISYGQIAEDTRIARRHVAKAMRALKKAGVLVCGGQAGRSSWLICAAV